MTMTQLQAERDTAAGDILVTVPLSHGRVLAVRSVRPSDADGLERLFDGLCDEDRYFRFFSYFRPGRRFIEQMTRPGDEGGYHLVAVVSGPVDSAAAVSAAAVSRASDALVAEAGYVLLPDGNGEFALTVAAGWRGWLGPYLLDALVAAAAARGVPNLVADILVENIRMLSLVAERGYAVISREGAEIRVAIDAARPRPVRRPAR